MKTLSLQWICLALLVVVIAPAFAQDSGPDAMGWIKAEKIRAGYLGAGNPTEATERMASAGMNTVVVKLSGYSPGDAASQALVEKWAMAASQAKLRLFVAINFGGPAEIARLDKYSHEVDKTGAALAKTPCPLDERYWEDVVFSRAVELAKLAKKVPIAGIALDPEMYGADHSLYTTPCFCDNCWKRFVADRWDQWYSELMPGKDRYRWLTSHGLLASYCDRQAEAGKALAGRLEARVHEENPNLILGAFLADRDEWFMKALRLGMGTRQMPMLCWAESTYSTGVAPCIDEAKARIAAEGSNALFVGGLWIRKFHAKNVSEQCFHLARGGAGYWIYTLESLVASPEKLPEDYKVPDSESAYWKAFGIADQEIVRCLKDGRDEASFLQLRKAETPAPPTPEVMPEELKLEAAKEPEPAPKVEAASLPDKETRLRGANVLVTYAKSGEELKLAVETSKVGSSADPASYSLMDPSGTLIEEGTIALGEKKLVSQKAPSDGIYVFSINTGASSCRVSSATHPLSYLASPAKPLSVIGAMQPLYFRIPEDAESVRLSLQTEGPAEAVVVKLLTPDAKEQWSRTVAGKVDAQVAVSKGAVGPWCLKVEKAPEGVFENLKIALEPPITPCLADDPGKLVASTKW